MAGAEPDEVSDQAKERQRDEMGTLGSGNHYLEVQHVAEVYDAAAAEAFGLAEGDVVVIDPLRLARPRPPDRHRVPAAHGARPRRSHGIELPDRELACAPIDSDLGASLPRRDARRHQLRPREPRRS